VLVEIGVFFGKVAVVSFGGAYAVLAYVAQEAVHTFGWLRPEEMLDGLGLAETTPGPLIMVVQFVAFMGAWRNPGALDPTWAAVVASCVAAWVTFVPSFLWIFLGGPYVERLRQQRALADALSAVSAAVVGVIAHLASWFSLQVLFERVSEIGWGPVRLLAPDVGTVDGASLVITSGTLLALWRWRWGLLRAMGVAVAAGIAWRLWRP
jgi:chromate transporter